MDFNSKYKSSEIEELLDKAATAVQPSSLANVATSGSYNDLSDKPTIPDISGKVDKVVGKQLSTEDFTTALKTKLEGLSNYDDTEISNAVSSLQTQLNTLVSGNANDAINSFNEIIAFLDGVNDTQDLSSIIASIEQQIAAKMDKVTLSAVATSGSYNDLSDRPTIPAAVTESTVSGWGFTKNTGTYSKPSAGIPKSDLASAVQTSLGLADTALQSYTEQYKGTVTGVKINGSTKSPSSGTVDIGNVATSIKINGSTKNPSSGVVDLGTVVTDVSGKQDKLVSGTNIKTINGQSILGSGNLTISGGGGEEQIDQPYIDDHYVAEYGADYYEAWFKSEVNKPMLPNVTYICPVPVWVVYIDAIQPPTGDIGKYTLHFNTSNDSTPGIVIADNVLMANGDHNEYLLPNTSYEVSIVATKFGNDYKYKCVITPFS